MFRPQSSLAAQERPRSNARPVRPQRTVGRSFETEERVPVHPPRSPVRPGTPGGGQLASPPPSWCNPTRASGNIDNHREGWVGEGTYKPSANAPPPKFLDNRKQSPRTTTLPQLNTLDRKILQELKRSMLARSAQFTLKKKIKHHPFPPNEVPYPRSYDHKCIDTDVWESIFCEQFCKNVTFHTFEVLPTKVLDLGCGSGSWIISCARRWKECHFVGLDIVPLHPDLGQSELSQRVNWVQANFLEPLPFPNEEFDFVHIKRIARGVPENKWDALFEEIVRVMKPGAALEMLEEDLYIPGQMIDSADDDSPLSAASASSSGSSDELSQLSVFSIPGPSTPSTSLPEIFTGQGSSSVQIRKSTLEKVGKQPSVGQPTSNTRSPPRPTRAEPRNVRPFPVLKPPKSTSRPTLNPFNLHNLLPKRSGRDDGAGTDGERPRKNKEMARPVSLSTDPHPPPVPGSSATPDQRPAMKVHRSMSSGERPPSSKPYFNTTGISPNPMFGSNTSVNILPVPMPQPHKFGARDHLLALPQIESTNGKLGANFPRNGQNEEPRKGRTRSLSCPTPEDDRQWRFTPSLELESFDPSTLSMHHRVQQVRPPHVQNPRNSGAPTDTEPVRPDRQGKKFTAESLPPLPSPKDIPEGSRRQAIYFNLAPSEASSSMIRLSRSFPDTVADRSPSTTLEVTAPTPMKSLSTSSLDVRPRQFTERVPPSLLNSHSSGNLGADNASIIGAPGSEIPTNPRQHKLLEVIYSEMHMARFVNLAPLSLLENYVQTYFKNVRTHAPLIFAFPPPPGCDHRPEFDAAELQRRKLNRTLEVEQDDDQDRYLVPDMDTPPSSPSILKPKPAHERFTRERSQSATTDESEPPYPRPTGVKATYASTPDSEIADQRRPRSRGSRFFAGSGDGLFFGTGEYVMMDKSMIGGLPPARVAKAAKENVSSASDERERSRLRSDSLFTRSDGAKEKGESSEGQKRSLAPAHEPTQLWFPLPPSLEYGNPNTGSSISLPISVASSSSSITIQLDQGKEKRPLTVGERTQLGPLPNKKADIDIKSLNLHLRVRTVEILGCSEAMWEWVKEFQYREKEKERKRMEQLTATPRKVQGVGGGRVSYFHQDHVRRGARRGAVYSGGSNHPALRHKASEKSLATGTSGRQGDGRSLNGNGRGTFAKASGYETKSLLSYSTTSSGSVRGDDPSERMEKSVKQELLNMKRDRFDEVLSWFQFDMDDSIRLTRSMATRTPSELFPTDLTEQRKSFDVACQKLETYLHQHPKRPRPPSLIKSDSTSSEDSSISGSPPHSQNYEEELCCLPPLLNLVHPSKRLCRTIRVWVAWKP